MRSAIVSTLLACAAAILSFQPASAKGALHEKIDLVGLNSVFTSAGIHTTMKRTSGGSSYISMEIGDSGLSIVVGGIACAVGACEGFSANAWYNGIASTAALMDFNGCCYARATNESGAQGTRIIGDYLLSGGVSDETILVDLGAFLSGMSRFAQAQKSGKSVDLKLDDLGASKAAFGFASGSPAAELIKQQFVQPKIDRAFEAEIVRAASAAKPAAMAAGAPSPAKSSALFDGVSIGQLQATFNSDLNLSAKTEYTESGIAYLAIPVTGTKGTIFVAGRGCMKERCQGFEYFVLAQNPQITDQLANAFNGECCFSRLVRASDVVFRLSGDFIAAGGVTQKFLGLTFPSFTEAIIRLADGLPGKGLAGKVTPGDHFAGTLDFGRLGQALRESGVAISSELGPEGQALIGQMAAAPR